MTYNGSCVLMTSLLATMLGLSACSSLPENLVASPDVALRNVELVDLSFKGQTVLLSFDVSNPNPFPLPVSGIDYGVKLDGAHFASGETVGDFTIPSEGESEFAISVELNLLQTAPRLLSIVRDGARSEIPYEVEGRFDVDIPFAPVLKYRNSGAVKLDSGGSVSSFLSN